MSPMQSLRDWHTVDLSSSLSNVFPEIQNAVLAHNISDFCKIVSSIRPVPLGLKHPGVVPPDHINFTYTGVNYHVFLSTGSPRCFSCGEFGHLSRTCKKPKDDNPQPENPLNSPPVFLHNKNPTENTHPRIPPQNPPRSRRLLRRLLGLHLRLLRGWRVGQGLGPGPRLRPRPGPRLRRGLCLDLGPRPSVPPRR